MKKTLFFRELFNKKPTLQANREEALFLALMSSIPGQSWYYKIVDSEDIELGINLPHGTITIKVSSALEEVVQKTGANFLPLKPSSANESSSVGIIDKLIAFATR